MKTPEKVIEHIVSWLNEYRTRSNMNGFVVGVSGGVDSAVTSTLCALTGAPVICLEMEIHQEDNQVSRANEHIKWLENKFNNVSHHNLSLSGVFDSFVNGLPPTDLKEEQLLSLANTRARMRMSTLYYFAALNRYLVAGTGNKIEDFGVGFYTKYGDGGVDLSPIADLLKSHVFKIYNIINEIIEATPTDGLWDDNRNDEDQIGASYEELEKAMQIAHNLDYDLSNREQEVLKIYKSLNSSNRHKMLPIPICKIPKDYIR